MGMTPDIPSRTSRKREYGVVEKQREEEEEGIKDGTEQQMRWEFLKHSGSRPSSRQGVVTKGLGVQDIMI